MQTGAALVLTSLLLVPAQAPVAPGQSAGAELPSWPAAPEAVPLPIAAPPDAGPAPHVPLMEVWGDIGINVYCAGQRTAPNGLPFSPLFDIPTELNLGLLPHKELYLYLDTDFWGQRATNNVTNPHQGPFDFSKREFDGTAGVAWNYWGPLEVRAFGFAFNNLNRGTSPDLPYGYNDGVGVENRLYLPAADPYDVAKQGFLSVGYLPSKTLVGLDGQQFNPGLFLRAYLTWDVPRLRSYLYCDGQYFGESGTQPRLLYLDAGVGVRPFSALPGLEFRIGGGDTYDVQIHHGQAVGYAGMRFIF
jgi:hypothetical protein